MKSRPKAKGCRATSSPPPSANGIMVKGRKTVTAPSRTDQADRRARDTRPARGMVREPTIGTRTVRSVIVSIFMRDVIY